jgi:MSHA pilin protein MshA
MQRTQQGFTLIELVVVIVILGILAATALPKFVDLSGDARTAAIAGVAGALSSSASINYGAYKVNSTKGTRMNSTNVCTTTILAPLLQSGTIPAGYTISGTGNCSTAGDGVAVSCTITDSNSSTSLTTTATIVCTN